jgi:galactofuranose transport system substrate-binding protein
METLRGKIISKAFVIALGISAAALVMLGGCANTSGDDSGQKTVAAPSFSPASGSYDSAQKVSIATATEAASIRYTNDGTEPTDSYGTLYSEPLSVGATETIKAIAYRSGWTSSIVSSSTFTIAGVTNNWVVGFSQIGSESDWRDADTRSIQNAFNADTSFTLLYSDAQQKQENQIAALRSFIARPVDCIIFTAIVEAGFGTVLQEAKTAGIPVIMVDRDVQSSDQSLRKAIIGSNFEKEGEKAATWLASYLTTKGIDDGSTTVNIVELQGTAGSAPTIDRKAGFATIMAAHSNWKITQSETGNFTSSDGKTVMAKFLANDRAIQVLYAHNDGMALGAIQAIKDAGLKPGTDITIIGVDSIKTALQAIVAGEMNCSVECSPLIGPQAVTAVTALRNGTSISTRIWTNEGIFDATNAAAALPTREY